MLLKQKTLEELILETDPKVIACGLMRAECEDVEHIRYYRKGAEAMLCNFIDDMDFVSEVLYEFDKIYGLTDDCE